MKTPVILDDEEWTRRLRLNDNRVCEVKLSEALEWIIVNDADGKKIGEFEFVETDYERSSEYRLTRMYLFDPSYKRRGIGRAASFYNTSKYDFEKLLDDAPNLASNLRVYLNGFSDNMRDLWQFAVLRIATGNAVALVVCPAHSPCDGSCLHQQRRSCGAVFR